LRFFTKKDQVTLNISELISELKLSLKYFQIINPSGQLSRYQIIKSNHLKSSLIIKSHEVLEKFAKSLDLLHAINEKLITHLREVN
jgi:hypothetical protein